MTIGCPFTLRMHVCPEEETMEQRPSRDGSRSSVLQHPEQNKADVAAIFGTTLATVIALTLGEGAWTWLSTAVGIALLLVLLAFYEPSRPRRRTRQLAASAAAGLTLTLATAWPL